MNDIDKLYKALKLLDSTEFQGFTQDELEDISIRLHRLIVNIKR